MVPIPKGSGKWEQDEKESKARSALVCVSGTPTSLALLECGGWEVRRKRRGSLSGLWQAWSRLQGLWASRSILCVVGSREAEPVLSPEVMS